MNMPKSKADIMRALRQARKDKGLKPVTVYIKPQDEGRLAKYVEGRLKGECPTKAKGT